MCERLRWELVQSWALSVITAKPKTRNIKQIYSYKHPGKVTHATSETNFLLYTVEPAGQEEQVIRKIQQNRVWQECRKAYSIQELNQNRYTINTETK